VAKPQKLPGFIELRDFSEAWERLGLEADDLLALQDAILAGPQRPPVIPGTGGLRKIRFAPPSWNVGKRGAIRICYVYFAEPGLILLMLAYCKTEKDTLTAAEKAGFRDYISRQAAAFAKRTAK
jgi:hypothetical protein